MHGHTFHVLGTGPGLVVDESKLNLADPFPRDTFVLNSTSWAVFRYKSDNPGIWSIHCHIEVIIIYLFIYFFKITIFFHEKKFKSSNLIFFSGMLKWVWSHNLLSCLRSYQKQPYQNPLVIYVDNKTTIQRDPDFQEGIGYLKLI
jgi:hypothetical protein